MNKHEDETAGARSEEEIGKIRQQAAESVRRWATEHGYLPRGDEALWWHLDWDAEVGELIVWLTTEEERAAHPGEERFVGYYGVVVHAYVCTTKYGPDWEVRGERLEFEATKEKAEGRGDV